MVGPSPTPFVKDLMARCAKNRLIFISGSISPGARNLLTFHPFLKVVKFVGKNQQILQQENKKNKNLTATLQPKPNNRWQCGAERAFKVHKNIQEGVCLAAAELVPPQILSLVEMSDDTHPGLCVFASEQQTFRKRTSVN